MTLNELIEQTSDIERALEESGGELTPELEEKLNGIGDDLNRKIDAYGLLIRRMSADIDASKKLVKDLQTSAKAKENNLKHLKEHLLYVMRMHGYNELKGETSIIKLRHSQAMDVDEETLLKPYNKKIEDFQGSLPSWIKLTPSVSKSELKEEFSEKELPDGAKMVTNTSINVK